MWHIMSSNHESEISDVGGWQKTDNNSLENYIVSIYCKNKDNPMTLEAKPDALRSVLDQPGIRELPIVVIPVAGELRGGKSFLLSYFIRYLKKKDFGGDCEELIGFDHKRSATSVTEGINIWKEPLIVETEDKEKILVLLMDSQGVFARKEDNHAIRIFALSTMLSSIMIYNLRNQLNEAVLNYQKLFLSYGKGVTSKKSTEIPFQKLLILIRDWQNDDAYDYEGGKTHLKEFFKNDENIFTSYFQDISCFLMPHPGPAIKRNDFKGCLKDLDQDFKENLQYLITDLCAASKLSNHVKEVAGNKVTAGDFCEYFDKCSDLINNMDWENQSCNIVEEQAKFMCEKEKKHSLDKYKEIMDKHHESFWDRKTNILKNKDDLKQYHENAAIETRWIFEDKCTFSQINEPQIFEKYKAKLNEELEEKYSDYKVLLDKDQAIFKERAKNDCISAKTKSFEVYKFYMKEIQKEGLFRDEENAIITKQQLDEYHEETIKRTRMKYEEFCQLKQVNDQSILEEYMDKLDDEVETLYLQYKNEFRSSLMGVRTCILESERSMKEFQEELDALKEDVSFHQSATLKSKVAATVGSGVSIGACLTSFAISGGIGLAAMAVVGTIVEVADKMRTDNFKKRINEYARKAKLCLEKTEVALKNVKQIIKDESTVQDGFFDFVTSGIWGAFTGLNAGYYLIYDNASLASACELSLNIKLIIENLIKTRDNLKEQIKQLNGLVECNLNPLNK